MIQPEDRRYKLVAFDVDGTLVSNSRNKIVWELLNQRFCPQSTVNGTRMRAYLDRCITYAEWVNLDVVDWIVARATREQMALVVRQHLQPTAGSHELLRELKERGYRIAIISGTLNLTIEVLFPEIRFDVVHANRLRFDETGALCGCEATPYDMAGKARALEQMATDMGISLAETAFVGDNVNDLEVMRRAGLAIAYEPKHPSVAEAAHAELRGDISGVLRLIESA